MIDLSRFEQQLVDVGADPVFEAKQVCYEGEGPLPTHVALIPVGSRHVLAVWLDAAVDPEALAAMMWPATGCGSCGDDCSQTQYVAIAGETDLDLTSAEGLAAGQLNAKVLDIRSSWQPAAPGCITPGTVYQPPVQRACFSIQQLDPCAVDVCNTYPADCPVSNTFLDAPLIEAWMDENPLATLEVTGTFGDTHFWAAEVPRCEGFEELCSTFGEPQGIYGDAVA